MPINAQNIQICKHKQLPMCKADDVFDSLYEHFTDIN